MADQKPKAKYQPHFHHEVPPLPPIKSFQLDHILHNELPDESQQVVDSLLKVSANYRTDLKKEIRNKLSIEQKLQYKNIDIAKRTNALEKLIRQENKRIAKVLSNHNGKNSTQQDTPIIDRNNSVDEEVLALVDLTESLSMQTMSLMRKLSTIDQVVNKKTDKSHLEKYSLVHSYVVKRKNSGKNIPHKLEEPNVKYRDNVTSELQHLKKDIQSPIDNKVNGKTAAESYMHMFEPIHEEINPEDFELFMANTLTKYRRMQLDKYNNLDIFLTPDDSSRFDNLDLFNSPDYDNSLSSPYHRSENPISLLYTKPSIKSMNEENSLTVAAKSPAIVTQNLQTSHFKKLRINGAPITSETFKKQQKDDCECNGPSAHAQDLLKNVKDDIESDNFDSSGLNTDTEDEPEDEEPPSTQSSDDSSTSEPEITGDASHYYKTLKKSMKKKHKRLTPKAYNREMSPTPKHQPSHYTLKPKGSILKFSGNQPPIVRRTQIKKTGQKVGLNYSKSNTMLSVNCNSTNVDIESVTASGIILPLEITDLESVLSEYEDNEVHRWDGVNETPGTDSSIRSLTKLRNLIHD